MSGYPQLLLRQFGILPLILGTLCVSIVAILIATPLEFGVAIYMREASLALGATHWQTIYKMIIPYASSGISAAVVLGIWRAIGETMVVLMVTGNAGIIPKTLLTPVRTILATIAAELGEAPGGYALSSAFCARLCFIFDYAFNKHYC